MSEAYLVFNLIKDQQRRVKNEIMKKIFLHEGEVINIFKVDGAAMVQEEGVVISCSQTRGKLKLHELVTVPYTCEDLYMSVFVEVRDDEY